MRAPAGWQPIKLGNVTFAVPGDVRLGTGQPVDSAAGWLEGDGYRITYDLGRFGERLDALKDERGFRQLSRVVAGRAAVEVAFAPSDEPFAWARIIQVDVDNGRTLTIRVSCDTPARCALAEELFQSIIVR